MSKRKTKEEWQIESDEIHNFEFEILDEPIGGQQNINILHKKCGNIINTKLNNHLKRYCKYCSGKNSKSLEEYQSKSDEIHNGEFEIIETPKNIKVKIKIKHKKCGNILEMTMNNHINHKNGCRICSKYSLKDNNHWLEKAYVIWGDDYTLMEDVVNVHKKIKIKHNLCGNILSKNMNNFIHGKRGCSICSKKEYGEIYIKEYLDDNNIKYTQQSTFDGLINPKTNRKLRVDFFLTELNIAIEVDGAQHYKAIEHWGGEKEFEKQKYRDNLKNNFFEKENIELIRISNKQIKNINKLLCQQKQ